MTDLRKQLKNKFFQPVHIDHNNVIPSGITITAEGADHYIDAILSTTREAIIAAWPEKKEINKIALMNGNTQAVGSSSYNDALTEALTAVMEVLGDE